MGIWRSLDRRREAETGIQFLVRYAEPAGKAADYVPVILVVGGLAEEGGGGHALCEGGGGVKWGGFI